MQDPSEIRIHGYGHQDVTLPHKIISVDDHVLEPRDLWSSRLPKKYADRGPRVVREKGKAGVGLAHTSGWVQDDSGNWADVWYYDDVVMPLQLLYGGAGFDRESIDFSVGTYEDLRPGCWIQSDRLADMDLNQTEAAICFPNTLPRFCGQTFAERDDKELAYLCVQAYNDWMIEDWCSGDGAGRLIPLVIVPLWDPYLAAKEVRRCAERGAFAITFSENPQALGLPSIYTDHWDPLFTECEAVSSIVCMHIGSSSRMPTTGPDAPHAASTTLLWQNGMHSFIDFIFSGVLERFPSLKIAYSESNVGWMPYVLERMDKVWLTRGEHSDFGSKAVVKNLPSSYVPGRIYGCVFDDEVGLANRDRIGMSQICFENDYPHADSLFPYSAEGVTRLANTAGLDDLEFYQFVRGNAIEAFGLERFGIDK